MLSPISSRDLQTLQKVYDLIKRDGVLGFTRALGWEPHIGQERWLLAPKRSTNVLVTGRRWGKSESSGVGLLYKALTRARYRACIISVTLDQARLSWDIAAGHALQNPIVAPFVKRISETPFPTLEFINGSVITVRTTARNGIYIRGHHFHEVEADEADYISEKIFDDVVRMTLADYDGQLTLRSTPKGKRGLVYRELKRGLSGDPEVYAQQGSTFENPNISHEYIERLREKMSAGAWSREVEGTYVDDDLAVFRWSDIQAAYETSDWSYRSINPDRWKGRRLVAGWDLAKSQDWTVCSILDVTTKPHKLVFWERFNRQPYPVVTAKMRKYHKDFGCSLTLFDSTGLGKVIEDTVGDFAEGYTFTKQSKIDILTNLQLKLEKQTLKFPFIKELVDELQNYEWDDDALITDSVMSLALAGWAADYNNSRGLVTWS